MWVNIAGRSVIIPFCTSLQSWSRAKFSFQVSDHLIHLSCLHQWQKQSLEHIEVTLAVPDNNEEVQQYSQPCLCLCQCTTKKEVCSYISLESKYIFPALMKKWVLLTTGGAMNLYLESKTFRSEQGIGFPTLVDWVHLQNKTPTSPLKRRKKTQASVSSLFVGSLHAEPAVKRSSCGPACS